MNQTTEHLARDKIDAALLRSGWVIQSKNSINLIGGTGVTTREYQTVVGRTAYLLFVNQKPVGIVRTRRKAEVFSYVDRRHRNFCCYLEKDLKYRATKYYKLLANV